MVACSYGAAFGAIQHVPRIVPGLPELADMARTQVQQTVSSVQAFQEFGGLAGRFIFALLAVAIVARRKLLRLFQIPDYGLSSFDNCIDLTLAFNHSK